jgi:NAD(P)-dependent dehydrogenase (short-subunit alcohol dehydrogenase family)
MSFVGKVVVVTGGSRGMGKEMVEAYAARGADVVVASRKLDNCVAVADAVRARARRARAARGVQRQPLGQL